MQKTKILLLLAATTLVIMAAIGVTYAQYVNTQNQTNPTINQTPAQQGFTGTCTNQTLNCPAATCIDQTGNCIGNTQQCPNHEYHMSGLNQGFQGCHAGYPFGEQEWEGWGMGMRGGMGGWRR